MSSLSMNHKAQIPELYVVRALAIIGVLLVHVSSVPVGIIADKSSIMFMFFNFLNIFNRYGTTTFIFLSAFVLFYRYYEKPISGKLLMSFYKRRLLYIGIPYVIFSILYYVIQMYYSYGETWHQFVQAASVIGFLKMLALGKSFYHLYFVFINIQFYLLFPLLLLLLQYKRNLTKHLIWIGFLLQWAFIIYNYYSLNYADKGQLAISYTSNYFLGAYFGIYYSSLMEWLVVTRKKLMSLKAVFWVLLGSVWLLASFADVYMFYWARKNGTIFNPLLYELVWNLHTITAGLVLLQLANLIYRKLSPPLVNIMLQLGIASFGIYIIHAGILFYYYRISVSYSPLIYSVYVAAAFVVTFALSWIIVSFIQKQSRLAWMLFGAAPKISPYIEWKSTNIAKRTKLSLPVSKQG
ncbi:acyltransferase [Paenibacillus psychroresistens]|uniref:acyltransferase n=1 Tax=Paenibacillus psychroresistens TaxID=1778678 RepID=UPI00139088DA|nr:acyltransferase [Paenibacillus psychroresistens]